jgi:endonuclease-8
MPEGDTVWLEARRLHEALAGQRLTQADLRVPALATVDLTGRTVTEVASRGKHLLMRTDDGRTLHSHLRMEGSWHLYLPDQRWRGGPMHTVRAILGTVERTAIGYRLGELDLWRTSEEGQRLQHLGPDVLGADWDLDEALNRLNRDGRVKVVDALRDQTNLAGLGNIYVCESLFLEGVDPFTPVSSVPDLAAVVVTARTLITRNAPRASQATTGDDRRPHFVHGRRRQPCLRCGARIVAKEEGPAGRKRWTYWCPDCQRPLVV